MKNSLTSVRLVWAFALGGVATVLAGADQPEGETVEMPPFVIRGISLGPAWRYAEIPGFEILTQCSDTETREIVAALWRGPQLVLPPALRPHFSLPMTVVLFNEPTAAQTGSPQTFGSLRKPGELAPHWINLIKRTLDDRESYALNLWPGSFSESSAFRFDIFTLLRRRAPAAPGWLKQGLFGGYGLYREGVYWYPGDSEKVVHVGSWWSRDEFNLARSLIGQAREQLAKSRRSVPPSALAPFVTELSALLERPAPDQPSDPAAERWAGSAALFARWGIYGGTPAQAEQFWRFADRACSEPVTEALFRECFGRSYADVQAELSWYLAVALWDEASAPPGDVLPTPKFKLREATGTEIARLRGEWERMEAAALAPKFPDIARDYRAQAVSTFNRAYNAGSRDPRLLASMGLLALDSQEFTIAAQYLELAVAGHVAGPRPYLEAARLRWAINLTDELGTIPAEKRAGIINLLLAAEQQGPPQDSVYLLLARAVTQAGTCTPEQAVALQRGLKYFPRRADVRERITVALHPAPAASP